jgi:uncharacterized protein (TIGR02145 family)
MKILYTIICLFAFVSCKRPSEKTFSDSRDRNEYAYVENQGKVWMTNNLRYLDEEIFNNGAYIWNYEEESYSELIKSSYSYQCVLYDWETAKNYCPDGWHLPSAKEWKDLISSYSSGKPGAPGLDKLNISFDGHARMFNKYCIFDGNTYWTRDSSESDQMAITVAIQHAKDGGIVCSREVSGIHNAFYVRCIKNIE